MWILATAEGELLACQPYGGASTKIRDYGLGQGPNVVLGLCEQFGVLPGSKVNFELIFRFTMGGGGNLIIYFQKIAHDKIDKRFK